MEGSGIATDNGMQNGKHSELASPEPTTEEKIAESLQSHESAESLVNDQVNGVTATEDNNHVTEASSVEEIAVNGCSVDTKTTPVTNIPEQERSELTETLKVKSTSPIEEPVPDVVPDVQAESELISLPPQDNDSGQATVAAVLDILSDTLVEPILNIESKEVESNSISEMLAEQSAHNSAPETLQNINAAREQPESEQTNEEIVELPKVPEINTSSCAPQDISVSTESQSTLTEKDIIESGASSVEMPPAETTEVVEEQKEKEQEFCSVTSNSALNSTKQHEPQSTSTKADVVELENASDGVIENNVEPAKDEAKEEVTEESKVSDISVVSTDDAAPQEPQPASKEGDDVKAVQGGDDTVEEPKTSDIVTISSSASAEVVSVQSNDIVEATEEAVEAPELPSPNENITTIAEDAFAQDTAETTEVTGLEIIVPTQPVSDSTTAEETCDRPKEEAAEAITEIVGLESVGSVVKETNVSECEAVMDAAPAQDGPETAHITETLTESPKENEASTVQAPVTPEINQDETYKAESAVVVSVEAEESNNEETVEVPSGHLDGDGETEVPAAAASEALFDIKDALETTPSVEQSKEEEESCKPAEETVDTAVKKPAESKDVKQLDSTPNRSKEEEAILTSFIMRDGKEVCSHCDQFIGLIKLTFSYPPMYLHPECLKCGVCTKVLGDLLSPMFEHRHRICCSSCYDEIYSLE